MTDLRNVVAMNRVCALLAVLLIATMAVPGAMGLGFSDESLLPPAGAVGKPYTHKLNGRAGSPPYNFKIDSGRLPPGVALSADGLISGTPTASGNYKIWANLADSWGKHSERQISIAIFEPQPPAPTTGLEKSGWELAWHDEFDAPLLDPDRWIAAYRGNPALPATFVIRDGVLHLRIDRDAPTPGAGRKDRVSGIETRRAGKPFAQQYGWFEMRCRTPKGSGVMAAFWMSPLDADYERLAGDGGKRASPGEAAEIDIFEQLGRETFANNHTVHFGRTWAEGHQTDHRRIVLPFSPQEGFHVLALQWDAKALVWYVDGVEVYRSDKTAHTPFFLRLSVYEGDDKWRGQVDENLPYPKDFEIDYVRVYRRTERAPEPPTQLVRDGDFRAAGHDNVPADWTLSLPDVKEAACTVQRTEHGLLMEAPQRPFAVGGVWQDIKGIEGGKAYAVEALCTPQHIPWPHRSLMVRVTWTKDSKPLHPAGEMVRGPTQHGDRLALRDVLVAPKEADGARVAVELKWPQGGSVTWHEVSVRPAPLPPPRKVKIGTVYLKPKNSTPEKNLDLFCQQIDEAGRLGLDVVCLPEAITMVGTPKNTAQVAQPIPGPDTERLAAAAKKNRVWVVAGLTERDGERVYNTAVLLGRDGKLAGKYRKIHLPREEWQKGIAPGSEYPVFETDFGKVAIQICYDWFFPEVDTIFGLKGAEIVFAPTWGTTFADQEGRAEGETVFRVRARDNGIYLVPSVYDGSSMVIDPLGRILVSNKGREGVFWCEVDLARREPLWWVGHWGSITTRDRMPPTYGPLVEETKGAGQ